MATPAAAARAPYCVNRWAASWGAEWAGWRPGGSPSACLAVAQAGPVSRAGRSARHGALPGSHHRRRPRRRRRCGERRPAAARSADRWQRLPGCGRSAVPAGSWCLGSAAGSAGGVEGGSCEEGWHGSKPANQHPNTIAAHQEMTRTRCGYCHLHRPALQQQQHRPASTTVQAGTAAGRASRSPAAG